MHDVGAENEGKLVVNLTDLDACVVNGVCHVVGAVAERNVAILIGLADAGKRNAGVQIFLHALARAGEMARGIMNLSLIEVRESTAA